MLDLPNLAEASFPNNVEIVKVVFFNFDILGHLNSIFHKLIRLLDEFAVGEGFFAFLFLFLVGEMFSVLELKSCFLLRINHEIVGQFVIEVVHI